MAVLKNVFIGYADRTLEQGKDAILAKINTPTGIPEMTDHTDSNPWIRNIDIWLAISELFNYYIDGAAQEFFLPVSEEYKSAAFIASIFDYRIRGPVGASVDLIFTLSAPALVQITIPAGKVIQTLTGVQFVTQEDGVLEIGETVISIPAVQEVQVVNDTIGQTSGLAGQKVTIDGNIVDESIMITIQAIGWFGQETFAFSNSSDKHFVAGMNENAVMAVEFGDGNNGAIPTGAQDIIASYRTTNGSDGNVPQNTITEIISAIVLPDGFQVTVTNEDPATGGYNAEGLKDLQKKIPLSIRTLYRAVTEEDYKAVTELAPGVARAGVQYICGKVIDIYISPEGDVNGVASTELIEDTQIYIDRRKMITTQVNVKSAGIVHVKMEFDVFLVKNSGFANAAKRIEGRELVADFLSVNNQEIYGQVEIGDIYQILEDMEGVDYTRMKKFTIEPYARPLDSDHQLIWTRTIKSTSIQTVKWKVVQSTALKFQLLKNGSFIGTYDYGTDISFDEIDFNITASGTYDDGNTWEFVTYKYNDNLLLSEPSVPVADVADIVLNVTGGI